MIKFHQSDYVLGTHSEEISRLEIQHRLWQRYAHDAWQRAGIREGSTVLDLGSGPGFATLDLARIVGSSGSVYAMDRSTNFLKHARAILERAGSSRVQYLEGDIMSSNLPKGHIDAVWCRWVACFVDTPERLVAKLSEGLATGGKVIFHEFFSYDTWRFLGHYPFLDRFVELVMESWRTTGGDPNIGRRLPEMLADSGFRITSSHPYVFSIRPSDAMWEWPSSFISANLRRLMDLGFADDEFAEAVLREFQKATDSDDCQMMTPVVIELIAEKL